MIKITFVDDSYRIYERFEYTTYSLNNGSFIVIRDKKWIGIYNMDNIKKVEVE